MSNDPYMSLHIYKCSTQSWWKALCTRIGLGPYGLRYSDLPGPFSQGTLNISVLSLPSRLAGRAAVKVLMNSHVEYIVLTTIILETR